MSEANTLSRASAAQRILDDPMVIDALAIIERDVIEAFCACPTRDLEGMRILQSNLRLARQFKGILQGAIERGKLASHELKERETFLQQMWKQTRRTA